MSKHETIVQYTKIALALIYGSIVVGLLLAILIKI